jgi:hypothetical protein
MKKKIFEIWRKEKEKMVIFGITILLIFTCVILYNHYKKEPQSKVKKYTIEVINDSLIITKDNEKIKDIIFRIDDAIFGDSVLWANGIKRKQVR